MKKTATYKVVIHTPKAKSYDALIVDATGIRWAIENASRKFREKYPSLIEGADFEIIEVEKV